MTTYSVTLEMTDTITGERVTRTIDKTNAMTNGSECYELRSDLEQREQLERWINERGNDQHDTILELLYWHFC